MLPAALLFWWGGPLVFLSRFWSTDPRVLDRNVFIYKILGIVAPKFVTIIYCNFAVREGQAK